MCFLNDPLMLQRRPEIHLFAARFRELQGDADGARVAFEVLRNELVPGLLEVFVKKANFEHRQVANYWALFVLVNEKRRVLIQRLI
jgi:hypothetical protein